MFSLNGLADIGFKGFYKVEDLTDNQARDNITNLPGIYVVVGESIGLPKFLSNNPGGRHKRKDPSVSIKDLQKKWVDKSSVLYIGKANNLRQRIGELIRFSQGEPIGHWGGRYLWQVAGSKQFLIAWLSKPGIDPYALEAEYLNYFEEKYRLLPFANLQKGRKTNKTGVTC